jgi:hypothetical protein
VLEACIKRVDVCVQIGKQSDLHGLRDSYRKRSARMLLMGTAVKSLSESRGEFQRPPRLPPLTWHDPGTTCPSRIASAPEPAATRAPTHRYPKANQPPPGRQPGEAQAIVGMH